MRQVIARISWPSDIFRLFRIDCSYNSFINSVTVLWGVGIIREDGDGICCCSGQPLQRWTFGLWMAELSLGEPWPIMDVSVRTIAQYINRHQCWWIRKIWVSKGKISTHLNFDIWRQFWATTVKVTVIRLTTSLNFYKVEMYNTSTGLVIVHQRPSVRVKPKEFCIRLLIHVIGRKPYRGEHFKNFADNV